jgi:hypothetical protein
VPDRPSTPDGGIELTADLCVMSWLISRVMSVRVTSLTLVEPSTSRMRTRLTSWKVRVFAGAVSSPTIQ